jgi:hypothetical protein
MLERSHPPKAQPGALCQLLLCQSGLDSQGAKELAERSQVGG